MFYRCKAIPMAKSFVALLLMLFSVSASAVYNVSPTSLNFGDIAVNSSSGVMTVTFNNTNTSSAIDFTSISASGDFSITHNCPMLPALLDELTSCTIDVTFSPLSSGPLAGTLTLSGHDRSIVLGPSFLPFTETITLSGNGLSGDISVNTNSLDLGSVTVGTASNSVPVTLSQSGNAPVDISSITATAPFSQSNDCPATLAVGASCSAMVNITATSTGQQSGTLDISGSGPQGPVAQSVSLAAFAANAPVAILSVSPMSLAFPDTPVNSLSDGQSVSIVNQGNSSVTGLTLSTIGDFTQTNDCPTTLNPAQSCFVSVSAEPSAAGDLSGSLEISGLDGTQTISSSVALSVHGTIADLITSETELTFTDSPVDSSSEPQVVTLSNQGSAPLAINSITTEGDFTQTNDCGTELPASGSCDIQVVFSPQSEGSASGALNIDTENGLARIVLSGTADAPSQNPVADLLRPYTGGNPNVISTSEVIGEACPSGRISARMQEDCNDVVGAASQDDANTASALSQITPESATKANSTSRQGSETQTRNLGSRIAALRAGARGLSFQGLGLRIDDQSLPIEMIAQAYDRRGAGASADNPLLDSRLGVFITGEISTGSKDETDLESGLDFDTYGITVGVDYRITNQFILGGALGYIDTDTELENDAGEIDTQGYSLSLYGTYYAEQNYFIDFSASYGANNFDQSRRINYQLAGLADVNQKLSADYDGDMFSFFIGSGYDFNRGPWTFGPRADLEYIKSDVDEFTEEVSNPSTDGGGWATRIESTDQNWLTLNVGGRLSYTHGADWGVLIPYARLDWLHEFEDDSQVISAHFVSDPGGNAIRIETDDPDRDYLRLRIGTSAQFQNGMVGFINYGTILAHSDWTAHTISVGFRTEF